MVEKVIRDGKVAVLYSPGFGAGWSTWADSDQLEIMMFHPKLVEAVENEVKDIEPLLTELFGEESPYAGGWRDIEICWVPQGTKFIIDEYDGSESIELLDDIPYYEA